MTMKYNFSVCFFLSWNFSWHSDLNSLLFTKITASPSVSPLLVANPIFFYYSQKDAYTPCGIMTNHCRFMLIDIRLILCDNSNSISFLVFHNCKFENTSFRWLDCCRLRLILDHWFMIWLLKFLSHLMFLIIILPWLRILMYLIVKPLGIRVTGFIMILWKL